MQLTFAARHREREETAMPYRSEAQRPWAHTKAGRKALGGGDRVREWDRATAGRWLPERIGPRKKKKS